MHALSHEDTGLWALQVLLRFHRIASTVEEIRRHLGHGAIGIAEMLRYARMHDFIARSRTTNWARLGELPLPGIAALHDGHFLFLGGVKDDSAVVLMPTAARPTVITRAEFEEQWDGRIVWLGPPSSIAKLFLRFDTALAARAHRTLTTIVSLGASNTQTAIVTLAARFRELRRMIVKLSPDKTRRQTHELAFLPAALEIVETPPSPLGRNIAFSIIAVFGFALAWACIGTVDIVAVAPGKIIPAGRTKTIQPLEAGVVRAIQIHDGQSVKAGDILVKLDTTAIDAELRHLKGDLMATRLEAARLHAAIANKDDPLAAFKPPQGAPPDLVQIQRGFLVNQTNEQKAKLSTIDGKLAEKIAERATTQASIDKLKATVTPLEQRVEVREKLFQKGLGSKLTYLTDLQDLIGQRQDILVQKSRNTETNAAIDALMQVRRKTVAEYEREMFDELAKAEQKAAGLRQDIIKVQERRRLKSLVAPVDGTVQQLAVHTVGSVVTPAEKLMVIVPAKSHLEIEAMISNRDIGFVAAGQEAAIKVDTFNFTRYGLLHGTIIDVSKDSIPRDKPADPTKGTALGAESTSSEPRGQELLYAARISLDRTQLDIGGKNVNLSPGMAVTTEIKTGKRRIISYLLSPLARYGHDSLRGR